MTMSQFQRELKQLKQSMIEKQKVTFPQDPLVFCKETLGFTPTAYQTGLINQFQNSQFVAGCWGRQSGKSHTVSALLLHYALTNPNASIAIVGPSWRQTKLDIKNINGFLATKIPRHLYRKLQKTMVALTNGSTIEAYPNNPDTIRGPKLHIVYADEFNFIPNDEEMYDAMLFTLGTTNGKFVCTSTPWRTDSIFYKIFHDSESFGDFAKSHVTYQEALEPNGPLKPQILNRIKKQLEGDPSRWKREMEAEWSENEDAWLNQALITQCIDHALEYQSFEGLMNGDFYAGLDLGKHHDPSVLAIVRKEQDKLSLVHLHRFPLETPYVSVIGYLKTICDRWQIIKKTIVDQTGVGEYITEDMKNSGLPNIQGITFTGDTKQEMAQHLKQAMTDRRLLIPYDSNLIAELNLERYELTKEGKIKLFHPLGTHDDRFWAVAMAAYAARKPPSPAFGFVYNPKMPEDDWDIEDQRDSILGHGSREQHVIHEI